MRIFSTVLFIHVLSSMALFATFALEAAVFLRIRSARSADQVYAGVLTFERLRRIAIPAFLGLLVGGGYLASRYGIGQAWILTSLAATLLIMLVGGLVTGVGMARLKKLVASSQGAQNFEIISSRVQSGALGWSYGFRVGAAVGIVFLMTNHPAVLVSITALAGAALTGVILAARYYTTGK